MKKRVREPQPIILPAVRRESSSASPSQLSVVSGWTRLIAPHAIVHFCRVCDTSCSASDCYCGYCGAKLVEFVEFLASR